MIVKSIKDVCAINPKGTLDTFAGLDISFVPMEAVSTTGHINTEKRITVDRVKNYTVFREGDILFAKITPCMENGKGAIAVNLHNGYGAGSTEFIVLRPDLSQVTAEWIQLFLSQKAFRLHCQQHMTGSAGQKRVPAKFLGACTIPVPPLEEQKRIVARIEELFSELDNGVETLRKTKQQLAVYRQAVLKAAFRSVSSRADEKTMGSILIGIEGGKSFKCEERPPQEHEYGIVKVSAVTWGTYNELESKTCRADQFLPTKRIGSGDFLFSRANTLELIGNCVVVEKVSRELMLSDKILRFHFVDGIVPKYVMYFLRTHDGKKQIQALSTGNQESMRNIGQDRIRKIQIPICSVEDQNSVVTKIESRLSVCDSIEKTVDTALQQAEAMRQSILKQAFM